MITSDVISEASRVTLNFSLKLEDGSVIDSNFDKKAVSFAMGDGSLLAGFEKKLLGLSAGQQQQFSVLPEEGFGQPNPNNIQRFGRKDFAEDMELVEGMVISFADAAQSELPGVVKSVIGDEVVVDFNHPLAGKIIQFEVSIVAVEQG
ncbi:FKBP-type peptidyl-prolyl cis-trans isomerase [Oceanicoccus sp. KOV_DT_Chl]|uniref:FKBP-type peptidyl-prolyl cis-trans isomerase n=1 Tax=Oceanicoccus sp. KOV_DT_Chl TaxID=1904639 RepID=UPI000C7D88C1|nr:FKBP-type peptidyl-prolyl cis-trans isomerase [Oceanicoccus sp. KOV_DT_Chl]